MKAAAAWLCAARRQACLAHLIRDFIDVDKTYPGQIWPAQARRALSSLS